MKRKKLSLLLFLQIATLLTSCGDVFTIKDKAQYDKNGNKIEPNTTQITPNDNSSSSSSSSDKVDNIVLINTLKNLFDTISSQDYESGVQFDSELVFNAVPNEVTDYRENKILTIPLDINVKYNKKDLEDFTLSDIASLNINYDYPLDAKDFSTYIPLFISSIPNLNRIDTKYFSGFSLDYIGDGSLYYSIKADDTFVDENNKKYYIGDNDTLYTSNIKPDDIKNLIPNYTIPSSTIPYNTNSVDNINNKENIFSTINEILKILSKFFVSSSTPDGLTISLGTAGSYLLNYNWKSIYKKIMSLDTGDQITNKLLQIFLKQIFPEELDNIVIKVNENNGVTTSLEFSIIGRYNKANNLNETNTYTFVKSEFMTNGKNLESNFFDLRKEIISKNYNSTQNVIKFVDEFDILNKKLEEQGESFKNLEATKNKLITLYNTFDSFSKYQKASVTGKNNNYALNFDKYYKTAMESISSSIPTNQKINSDDIMTLKAISTNPYSLNYNRKYDSNLIEVLNKSQHSDQLIFKLKNPNTSTDINELKIVCSLGGINEIPISSKTIIFKI
ncbi:MAG: hypothetical protein MR606_05690 [Mollicutes bacterium]|nr:hypothetical protein [Mollicutes bacterium]MDD7264253.1 hypothetical protein [bacterium]MDY4980076.1 hypothetical protein [Candidatus Onthovivens sp.]